MAKFYTETRKQVLKDLVKAYNENRGSKHAIDFDIIQKNAGSSWNNYQKQVSTLKNMIKSNRGYSPNDRQMRNLEILVYKFNSKIDNEGLAIRKINADKLAQQATSWNNLQRIMKNYRGLLKSGATNVVGATLDNKPIYKWEQDTIKNNLATINENRAKALKKLQLNKYTGTMFNPDYFGFFPKPDPFARQLYKSELEGDVRTVIRQASPDYIRNNISTYKENLLTAITHITDTNLKERLYNLIMETDAETLFAAGSGDALISIGFIYEELSEFNTYNKRGYILYNRLQNSLKG